MIYKIKAIIFIFLIKFFFIINIFCAANSHDNLNKVTKDLNKPEKIADWVKKNIKYVSKYGINEFNDPEKTFELRKGNCAEMAKLTFYFLKSHGYNPNLMVIQLGPSDPKNHVVCIYITKDKKVNKIDNGRLSKGFTSYKDIAFKHDEKWWRYLLFDNIKNFNDFKNPIKEIYQDKSKKVVKKYAIDQSQISIFYKKIRNKIKNSEAKLIKEKNNKYITFYYGDEDGIDSKNEVKLANSTGWTHLIYYKNRTDKKSIYSIIINGKFYGTQNNNFQFFLIDTKGETFFTSKEYPYSSFPKKSFENKEFVVNIKKVPNEFFIVLKTFSSRENGVSIKLISSGKNVYSYNYSNSKEYNEYKNANLAIFPKLY